MQEDIVRTCAFNLCSFCSLWAIMECKMRFQAEITKKKFREKISLLIFALLLEELAAP